MPLARHSRNYDNLQMKKRFLKVTKNQILLLEFNHKKMWKLSHLVLNSKGILKICPKCQKMLVNQNFLKLKILLKKQVSKIQYLI